MNRNTLPPVVAFIVIGAGGFFAGRFSSPEAPHATAEQTAEAKSGRAGREHSQQADAATRRQARAGRGASVEGMARLTSIMRREDPLDRNRALFDFVDRLGPDDFAVAVQHFQSLGLTESRMGEYALLISAWAKLDPLAALDFAKANPNSHVATTTVLATWAARDPDAALRWAETHHEGSGPNPYLVGVIRGIAESDPERAAEMLTKMPGGSERYEALAGVLPQLLAQGTDVARSWIEGLADESLRDAAMKRIADHLASIDPAGTAQWLLDHPGGASQGRMDEVYGQWARLDQQAALDSVSAMPTGDNRSNALSGVVGTLATSDPAAALSVMDRFPEDVTENVMKNFLWNSLESDPGLAMSQIPRIPDEVRRDWWYGRTLESWLDRDATAAKAWIQKNPLPQAVLDQLADRLGSQP